jgi:hypothetical protein
VSDLRLVPIRLADAKDFVRRHHRTHLAPVGHKFSVGVAAGDVLVGVAMVGRPVARAVDDGLTVEVNRTCTDGYPNAGSMLYGAVARASFALGYRRVITYTQSGESGASLRAANWRVIAERPPRSGWWAPSRPREGRGADVVARTLWEAT